MAHSVPGSLSRHRTVRCRRRCGAVDDDDTAPASAAECREVLANCRDLAGTASEVYLKRRGLPGPYPADLLGHLDDARIGESAFVGKLTEHGRITGVLLTYLTPDGEKSLVEPVRRRLNLEKSPGGVFRIPEPDPAAPLDPVADYLVGEGVEDALSLAQLGRNLTIFGVPGVGTIQHLDLPKGARVTFVKDGDEPDTPAAKSLINGVDAQLLKGVYARVTETPLGDDANKILQERGLEALRELAARPPEAALSFHGRIVRLSKIDDPVAFAEERRLINKIFGVSVKVIDEEVKKLPPPRETPADTPAADAPGSYEGAADPAWEGDVDLAAALNSAVTIMQRFLKAPAYVYDTITLWAVMTYLVQSEEIDLPIAPQLGFQSLTRGERQECRGSNRRSPFLSGLFARQLHRIDIVSPDQPRTCHALLCPSSTIFWAKRTKAFWRSSTPATVVPKRGSTALRPIPRPASAMW